MHKLAIASAAALYIAAISPSYAQTSMTQVSLPSQGDLQALTDVRVEIVKGALQLKPEQVKHWQAVEEAIRGRAAMRHQRLAKLAAMRNQERDPEPIEIMRLRADGLAQRSAALKKLADAWQPLYESLDPQQKFRLGILTLYGLEVAMQALDQFDEEDE